MVKIETVMRTPGSLDDIFLIINNNARDQSQIASVKAWVPEIAFCITWYTISYWCSHFHAATQNILLSCELAIIKAHALVNHTTTGWERKLTITPSLNSPSISWKLIPKVPKAQHRLKINLDWPWQEALKQMQS